MFKTQSSGDLLFFSVSALGVPSRGYKREKTKYCVVAKTAAKAIDLVEERYKDIEVVGAKRVKVTSLILDPDYYELTSVASEEE